MEKVIAPNRKTGRMMAKNLIILLTVAIVAFIGIWAWFTNRSTATADGINVKCQAPDGVEIAVVEHGAAAPSADQYSTSVTLDSSGFLAKLIMSEVTSDGITFYKPTLTQKDGVASPNPEGEWNIATAGQDYMCFDLYMRTQIPKKIYLESTSSVSPNANTLTWTDGDGSGNNPSTYGYFSKDCIVGAARTSVLKADNKSSLLMWIPRPDILLTQNGSDYSVTTGNATSTSGSSYIHSYWDENKTHIVAADPPAITSKVNGDDTVTLGQRVAITEFDTSDTNCDVWYQNDYYYTHVVYNTWIEGDDTEARLALSGGLFTVNLTLVSDETKN